LPDFEEGIVVEAPKNAKKEENFKYFLLREYINLQDPNALVYFKKCFNTTYIRVATLHLVFI
ncbi:24740_t:CDS:1, partial [Gigaspora rosea]